MAVRQVDKSKTTKDGRSWYFYTNVTNNDGTKKRYQSKKFATKQEAIKAEREFIVGVQKKEINVSDMTFEDLFNEFWNYKKDKVKDTTKRTYIVNVRPLKVFFNKKIRDFTVNDYLKWRNEMSERNIAIRTKNGYHKFFKELLNYGTKWFDFNFTSIYNKMEKFTDPNALPHEMEFYTFEEFKQYISVVDDIKYKALFETLYYCGLRRGELRGLTWNNIDFKEKTLSVEKNCTNTKGDHGYWQITTPKTRTSTRTLPMPDILVEDLKNLKEHNKEHQYGFNEKYFVFGDINPIHPDVLRRYKNNYAELAGVKQIRIHDFRHSCASLLINNGASIMVVAKYLGHAKIDETLNTYSHLFKNKMDEIVDLMNKLNSD